MVGTSEIPPWADRSVACAFGWCPCRVLICEELDHRFANDITARQNDLICQVCSGGAVPDANLLGPTITGFADQPDHVRTGLGPGTTADTVRSHRWNVQRIWLVKHS